MDEMELTRGERFKDARVIHNQHGKQTQEAVDMATGVSASCIKDLEDDNIQRGVSYEKIAKLAKHYGVSADWLLGLSNVKTNDTNLRAVCEYTGLSESAIKLILDTKESSYYGHKTGNSTLNTFITNRKFRVLLERMSSLSVVQNGNEKMLRRIGLSRNADDIIPNVSFENVKELSRIIFPNDREFDEMYIMYQISQVFDKLLEDMFNPYKPEDYDRLNEAIMNKLEYAEVLREGE